MGTSRAALSALLGGLLFLAGCTPALGPSGQAHEHAVREIVKDAKEFGFGGGDIRRNCGSLGAQCTENDNFESSTMVVDASKNDAAQCSAFFALGDQIGATWWRRDMHPEEPLINPDLAAGEMACIESLGLNSADGNAGQSEGVLIGGAMETDVGTSGFIVQINSVSHPDGAEQIERGYYFSVFSTDEIID